MMKEGEHPLGGNYIMACRDLFQEVITFVFLMSISDCTWPRKPLHPDMWRWKSVKSLISRHGIYQQKRKGRRDASFLNAPPLRGMVSDKDIWKVGLLSRIHFTWPIPFRIPSTIKWKCTDKKDLQNGMRWQKRTYSFWNEYNFDIKHHRPTAALRSSSMMNSHFARGELARSGPHQLQIMRVKGATNRT